MNDLFGETRKFFLYPWTTDIRLGIFGLIRKVASPEKDCAYVFCSKDRLMKELQAELEQKEENHQVTPTPSASWTGRTESRNQKLFADGP